MWRRVLGLGGTWLTRTLPEAAEAGGGLMVATIQLAITLGASLGGLLFDLRGYRSTFAVSAVLLCGSASLVLRAGRAAVVIEPAFTPSSSTATEIQM